MAATVEEVCFEVNSSFYLSKKNHLAVLFNTSATHSFVNQYVNLDFAKSYETLSGMAVSV